MGDLRLSTRHCGYSHEASAVRSRLLEVGTNTEARLAARTALGRIFGN